MQMERNIEVISKKIWKMMRVAIYMIKKGICKRKLLIDLNMMMKRGKIAGKALGNLMFHHHHHHFPTSRGGVGKASNLPDDTPQEFEFSCNNTPLYRHYLTNKREKKHYKEIANDMDALNHVVEFMLRDDDEDDKFFSAATTPSFLGLGFGRSPVVRQLRITDSPFPLRDTEDNKHVDQAAEDFIQKFYSKLKQQKYH